MMFFNNLLGQVLVNEGCLKKASRIIHEYRTVPFDPAATHSVDDYELKNKCFLWI